MHATPSGILFDRLQSLAFRSNKEHILANRTEIHQKIDRISEQLQGLLQINDMNTVSVAENEFLHFRIPTACLVSKMDPGLKQLLY
jgi:hypothetical protein